MANPTKLSPGNIAQAAFDDNTKSIKVSLIGSGTPTMPSIVQLSDGVGNISSTVVGSDRALDVNIVNGIELTVSHLDDSIALGDGTGLITSTVKGSKRTLDVTVSNNGVASLPYVSNVSMPSANTEYSFTLMANTKQLTFKTRQSSLLKFTFQAGESATTYISVSPGSSYTLQGIDPSTTITLYFQSPNNSETLELISWV